jgi:hypothetical protein
VVIEVLSPSSEDHDDDDDGDKRRDFQSLASLQVYVIAAQTHGDIRHGCRIIMSSPCWVGGALAQPRC